jgi:hypothetical protein
VNVRQIAMLSLNLFENVASNPFSSAALSVAEDKPWNLSGEI